MNLSALTVLASSMAMAQPVTPSGGTPSDVRFVNKRTLTIPMSMPPARAKELKEVSLFLSRDNGDTYEFHQAIKPTDANFTLNAKEDGLYWVQVQENFLTGTNVPKNPREMPPAEKLVIDTVKPLVKITAAEIIDSEVRIEWKIEDRHPSDATTKIFYMPSGADTKEAKAWREVPASSINKRTARFKPDFAGPVMVQVATADLAMNIGAENREVGGKPAMTTSTAMKPVTSDVLPLPKEAPGLTASTLPEPGFSAMPATGPIPLTAPVLTSANTAPAPTASFAPSNSGKPIATGSGPSAPVMPIQPAAAATVATDNAPLANTQMSKSPRFELNYTLDVGPSGVARVDLYVTRDDGRSWIKWSTHDGRENPLKVILDTRFNKEVEGDYGLALVPTSGAGLSESAPSANTNPELRVRVDMTAPVIKVYQPTADPNNKHALLLNWEATDANFGKEPIAIEYAEDPRGPWKSVSAPDAVSVQHRIDNTGSYSWQPPMTLTTPKVYLRFTAWDTAGNKSDAVTPNPILVDLTKPKARIQGITQVGMGK